MVDETHKSPALRSSKEKRFGWTLRESLLSFSKKNYSTVEFWIIWIFWEGVRNALILLMFLVNCFQENISDTMFANLTYQCNHRLSEKVLSYTENSIKLDHANKGELHLNQLGLVLLGLFVFCWFAAIKCSVSYTCPALSLSQLYQLFSVDFCRIWQV